MKYKFLIIFIISFLVGYSAASYYQSIRLSISTFPAIKRAHYEFKSPELAELYQQWLIDTKNEIKELIPKIKKEIKIVNQKKSRGIKVNFYDPPCMKINDLEFQYSKLNDKNSKNYWDKVYKKMGCDEGN